MLDVWFGQTASDFGCHTYKHNCGLVIPMWEFSIMRPSGPIVSAWIVGDWGEKASKVGMPNHLETGEAAGSTTAGYATAFCSGSMECRIRQTAHRPGRATTTVKTKN